MNYHIFTYICPNFNMDLITLVSEELAYYLLHHSTAAIPGLGSFESIYQSATVDQASGMLLAPSTAIAFSSKSLTDNRFQTYLNKQYPDQNVLESFVDTIHQKIENATSLDLPELGQLSKGEGGTLAFSALDEADLLDDFSMEGLVLKPIQKEAKEVEPLVSNMPGASTKPVETQKSKFSLLRIGMISSVLVLTIAFLINQSKPKDDTVLAQKVSAKYNVSPQDIQDEIIIVSNETDTYAEEISVDAQKEIIERQEKMSAEDPAPILQSAIIRTNTFRNQAYVNKQLELIESLGYKSGTLLKDSGLTATQILLNYHTEEDLTAQLAKIKERFPRAKLSK